MKMNNVLITRLPLRSFVNEAGLKGAAVDGSALPFIVEELIASGALGIAVPSDLPIAGFVQHLDPTISSIVDVVDSVESKRRTHTFLEPLAGLPTHSGLVCGLSPRMLRASRTPQVLQ